MNKNDDRRAANTESRKMHPKMSLKKKKSRRFRMQKIIPQNFSISNFFMTQENEFFS